MKKVVFLIYPWIVREHCDRRCRRFCFGRLGKGTPGHSDASGNFGFFLGFITYLVEENIHECLTSQRCLVLGTAHTVHIAMTHSTEMDHSGIGCRTYEQT